MGFKQQQKPQRELVVQLQVSLFHVINFIFKTNISKLMRVSPSILLAVKKIHVGKEKSMVSIQQLRSPEQKVNLILSQRALLVESA